MDMFTLGRILGKVSILCLLINERKDPNKLKNDNDTYKLPHKDNFYLYLIMYPNIFLQCCYLIQHEISGYYSQNSTDSIAWSTYLCLAGLIVCTAGCYLRKKAKQQLGEFFTYKLGVNKGQKLITNGLYSHLMHPSYLGACMLYLGISIAYQSLILFTMFIAFITIVAKVRIPQEETMLATHFAAEYEAYRKNRWRMIPFVY